MVSKFFIVLSVILSIGLNNVAYSYNVKPQDFMATAYTLAECEKLPTDPYYGITASGSYVRQGYVAVDTDVIPMHSVLYIKGSGGYDGIYLAKDRGGAIEGNRIDIYIPDKKEAIDFGVKNVKVFVLRKGKNVHSREFKTALGFKAPVRKTEKSAGYDFFLKDPVLLEAHSLKMVNSGIKVAMEDDDVMLLFVRSSIGKLGVGLANGVAVIDADFEDEMLFPLYNYTDHDILLEAGERVVQGVFLKYHTIGDIVTAKRTGGFGSTNDKNVVN